MAAVIGPTVFVVGKMITSVYAASKAIKVFSLALSASPIGLAVTGLTVLTVAFAAFNKSGRAIGSASKSVTQSIKNEQASISVLVDSITGLNKGNEVRKSLLDDLKSKYPSFLKNLDTEKVTNEELRKRLQEVNKEYVNKIAISAAEEQITENLKKQNVAFQSQKDSLIKINELKQRLVRADNQQSQKDIQSQIGIQQAIYDIQKKRA